MKINWPKHVAACQTAIMAGWAVVMVDYARKAWPWPWHAWILFPFSLAILLVAMFGPPRKDGDA
jgi:hypothetical protein